MPAVFEAKREEPQLGKWLRGLRASPPLITVGVPALVWALVVYCYGGRFSRYVADDYCTASELRRTGLIASQAFWYRTWSGRFSFTAIVTTLEVAGPKLVPYLAAALCSIWVALSFCALRQYAVGRRWRFHNGGSLLMAALLVFSTLRSTPDLGQSFYWQTGILTYALPAVLLTAYLFASVRFVALHPTGNRRALHLVIAGALTFLAGGLSETTLVIQITALGMALAGCWFLAAEPLKRNVCATILVGWFGTLLSFALVAAAPGNLVRKSALAIPPPGWRAAALLSFDYFCTFVSEFPHHHPAACAVLPCVGAMLAVEMRFRDTLRRSPFSLRHTLATWLVSTVGVVVLIFSSIFPSFWGQGLEPPGRALFLTTWIVAIWLLAAGTALGDVILLTFEHRTYPLVRACISLSVMAMLVLWTISSDCTVQSSIPRWHEYAEQWDRQDLEMRGARQQGVRSILLKQENAMGSGPVRGLHVIGNDPDFWVNACVASYYGLDKVIAVKQDQ
jgi:Family of unknown function (DUF6056)